MLACLHAKRNASFYGEYRAAQGREKERETERKRTTTNNVGIESIRKIVLSIYFSQRQKMLFQHSREQNE